MLPSAPQAKRRLKRAVILCSAVALTVTGCNTIGYYKQAAGGQYEILSRQEPIPALLARTNTPPALREQLKLILELRQFAERELHLQTDGHYAKYADLGRSHVVWNVYAAPEFSMQPKKWWYPVVGSLKYRGFFSEADARQCAARLAKEGYDVHVGGVDAYSTLGFFKDPVLNTFIDNKPADLAELLFHELAHQRLFAKGDTEFNEAFATAVGEEGARRWIVKHADEKMRAEYEADLRRKDQFVAIVLQAREGLKKVYGEENIDDRSSEKSAVAHKQKKKSSVPDEVKRAGKEQVIAKLRADYEQLKASWGGYTGYDRWFARPINNARLNTIATYYTLVPAFQQLLAKNGGDMQKFYAEAKVVASSARKERHERLATLARPTPAVTAAAAETPPVN
jgi:predicted aminopeptidase